MVFESIGPNFIMSVFNHFGHQEAFTEFFNDAALYVLCDMAEVLLPLETREKTVWGKIKSTANKII